MTLNEQAEKYLEGLLDKQERKLFEIEIKKNKELQEYIRKRIKLDTELSEYFKARMSRELSNEVEKDIIEFGRSVYEPKDKSEAKFKKTLEKTISKKSGSGSLNIIMAIAASISILILIGVGSFKKINDNNRKKLNAGLYESFFNPSADEKLISILEPAFFEWDSDSKDSIYDLYKISNDNRIKRSSDIQEREILSLALISMQKNDFESASLHLKNMLDPENSELNQISQWYYSLCMIASDKSDEAKNTLEILVNQNNYYSDQAEQLLDSIKAL